MSHPAGPDARPSRPRRIAHGLVRAAALILPASDQRWATAMLHETAHVGTDGEAMRWAAGCLYAACVERARSLYLLDHAAIRIAATLLAGFRVLDAGMPTLLTFVHRARAAGTSSLGGLTPGDDYERLVPLIDALPLWLHVMVVSAVILYVLAVAATWGRRSMAAAFWCMAIVAEQAASFAARPVLADVGVVVVQHPSVLAAVVLPILMPVLFAMASCSGSRTTAARTTTGSALSP